MQKVLVTGGVGYVGREIVRQLCDDSGVEVHVLDNLTCGEHRLTQMDLTRFRLYRCDLRESREVKRILENVEPDVIFHLAAVHYIPACERAPCDAVAINVQGTVNLLDAARSCRFVFASTAAVYPPSLDAHVEDSAALGPVDIYGYTKLHGEQYASYYHAAGRVDAVVVRLFNVVGPGETNPHIVPTVIHQISDGARRLKLGNLFPHRDYIDVSDVASGFRRLSVLPGRAGQGPIVCNVGTGRTHSVRDVVNVIGQVAGVELEITEDPARIRSVDRPVLRASTAKLRELTGWVPMTSLAESMRRAWQSRDIDRIP